MRRRAVPDLPGRRDVWRVMRERLAEVLMRAAIVLIDVSVLLQPVEEGVGGRDNVGAPARRGTWSTRLNGLTPWRRRHDGP